MTDTQCSRAGFLGHVLYEGDPKSESSNREITIDDHTVQVLREWRAVRAKNRRAAREAWFVSGYEFTDEIGRGIHPTRLSTRFTKALKSSGLPHAARAQPPARHAVAGRRRPSQGRVRLPGSRCTAAGRRRSAPISGTARCAAPSARDRDSVVSNIDRRYVSIGTTVDQRGVEVCPVRLEERRVVEQPVDGLEFVGQPQAGLRQDRVPQCRLCVYHPQHGGLDPF